MRLPNSPLACKVMLTLIYDYPVDTEWEGFTAKLRLSSFARACNTRNGRIKEALSTLEEVGYIEHLSFTDGFAKARIAVPAPILRLLS